MGWIAYSLLMFSASVVLYLSVRKAALIGMPPYLNNLAMFGVPLVAYVVLALVTGSPFILSWWFAAVIALAAVVFAYLGNKASLHAIANAPNPGYSLVLSKSYVLFTTVVAVTVLGAELTVQKAVAIVCIVAFSALIMIDPKNVKKVRSERWIIQSLGAFFAWGMLSLTSKYLFNQGLDTVTFLVYLYAIVTLCIITVDKVGLSALKQLTAQKGAMFALIGISSTLFNLGQFEAIRVAPNIGYVNAINAASISAVTVCALLLFKDELTRRKAVGIAGVTIGLVLLLV